MENKELLYNEAIKMIEKGDYLAAYNNLRRCKTYKDSKHLLKNFKVVFDKEKVVSYSSDGETIRFKFERDYKYEENDKGELFVSDSEKRNETPSVVPDESEEIDNSIKVCEYDINGNIILVVEHDENGKVCGKTVYEYDENNNQTFCIVSDADGEMIAKHEIGYDKFGNATRFVQYINNRMISRSECEYNEYGNVTLVTSYDSNGELSGKAIYKYVNQRVIYIIS